MKKGARSPTVFLSALSGVLISVMLMVNAALAAPLGNYTSTVIVHVVGLAAILLALVFTRSKIDIPKGIPFWVFGAGVIGVFTVLFNNIGFLELGATLVVALGLLGQTLTSVVIDHFGWFGIPKIRFDKRKLVGIALIGAGIAVMVFW